MNRLQAEQRTFYCVFADCTFQGFPYAHYDGIRFVRADSPGGGLELVVRFSGSVVEEVRIAGRNLRFVAVCIGLGIMPWVWELPPGQQARGDAIPSSPASPSASSNAEAAGSGQSSPWGRASADLHCPLIRLRAIGQDSSKRAFGGPG